ncbi:MAG: hypothetical protein ACOYNC_13755 [Bacteroidales bacterium]
MKIKMQIPDAVILISIASTTLYIASRNFGKVVGSFAFLWAPITLLIIFSLRPDSFTKGPIKILLFYGFLIVGLFQYLLWNHMDEFNQTRILFEFYYLLVLIAIFNFYTIPKKYNKLAWLGEWTFKFIIITLLLTNISLFFDSEIVREAARTDDFSKLQSILYYRGGTMSFAFAQSVIFLIPILIYHIKSKMYMVFSPRILTVILVIIIITEFRSQVFANIIVTSVVTVLSLAAFRSRNNLSFLVLLIIFVTLMSVPIPFYSSFLNSLSTYFNPNSVISSKLTDFAGFIDNPELDSSTGTGRRASRYPMLLEALLSNPFFGDASYSSGFQILGGAHLYWMNRLAIWGIPTFTFFIYMLFRIFKRISYLFDKSFVFYYTLSLGAFILMGLTKAIGGVEPWLILIVIIPGLYFSSMLDRRNAN